ncbi:hypothetical protein SAMN04515667_0183 [Formosa sp. Hel1_31_208]|nr:hypothetical protein SAMN04515667_0183 [Formosa sp. Hel1_31_208]
MFEFIMKLTKIQPFIRQDLHIDARIAIELIIADSQQKQVGFHNKIEI